MAETDLSVSKFHYVNQWIFDKTYVSKLDRRDVKHQRLHGFDLYSDSKEIYLPHEECA